MRRSIVNNLTNLPPVLLEWLKECGTSIHTIRTCRLETKLFHDLGLYGEIAEAYLETLVSVYGVDMQDFRFEKYFPAEFAGDTALTKFLITYLPFGRRIFIDPLKYTPITLGEIYHSIECGKWAERGEG
jgi:hypothetical protein